MHTYIHINLSLPLPMPSVYPRSALACRGPDPVACEGRPWDPNCGAAASRWESAQCSTCRHAEKALLLPILLSTVTWREIGMGMDGLGGLGLGK